jgi:hypothetical protein
MARARANRAASWLAHLRKPFYALGACTPDGEAPDTMAGSPLDRYFG